ncbi:hypothetical protein AV530_003106 [Patagioenas fasciata monilis]|uniref:Uncharacterized protein n=1 Tax=Patagioenas fasciata monilis TaxID=372326 RepID=A0A1V4KVX7_PATFA|nr:hypothetical protein AV530_003106 [Patagioenas fasciata monilis]
MPVRRNAKDQVFPLLSIAINVERRAGQKDLKIQSHWQHWIEDLFFEEQPEEETAETTNFRLPPHPSKSFQTACHKTSDIVFTFFSIRNPKAARALGTSVRSIVQLSRKTFASLRLHRRLHHHHHTSTPKKFKPSIKPGEVEPECLLKAF